MNHFRRLTRSAMALMTMAALSVGAFAADYSFETGAGTEYYPATSYADTYGAAYNYGGPNLVDYQIPELPYGEIGVGLAKGRDENGLDCWYCVQLFLCDGYTIGWVDTPAVK